MRRSFPALNKQISYIFHMNLQSWMRKLHFYAISDLSLGWPRRNGLVAPFYLFIDYSSSQPCKAFPDAAGKKQGSANGQAGFLICEVISVWSTQGWAPAPLLSVHTYDCCRAGLLGRHLNSLGKSSESLGLALHLQRHFCTELSKVIHHTWEWLQK